MLRTKMRSLLNILGTAAGGQTDNSSMIGRKYRLQDTKYGHIVGEYDTPEEAERAMLARPYTKIMSQPEVWQTQEARDQARQRSIRENPDEDPAVLHRKEVQD